MGGGGIVVRTADALGWSCLEPCEEAETEVPCDGLCVAAKEGEVRGGGGGGGGNI